MERELIVMAKAPLAGYAKSRLIDVTAGVPALEDTPDLGRLDADRVARIADAFIRDTLRFVVHCTHDALSLVFAPPESEPYFRAVAPSARLVPQAGGDLGSRLTAAFESAFEGGAKRVVAIGTDTPHLPLERIDEAFDALAAADCVLGPSRDGGYYLIGLTARRPELFRGVHWGAASVLAETLAIAAAGGLRVARLPEERDIDERADLEWLAGELRAAPARCPATESVLGELTR